MYHMQKLQEFIWEQMKSMGDLSMRRFADVIGVSQPTISRVLDPNDPVFPSIELLIKLARATRTDIRDLVVMVAPDDVIIGQNPKAMRLATRLDKLTDEQKMIIDRLIAGFMLEKAIVGE